VEFEWDPAKNSLLKETRGISFESVVVHLEQDALWKIAEHPNQLRYPRQQLLFVVIDHYVYIIPFERREDKLWLITIIPSRKATKNYREKSG
jgi:uncharacterized DUF497 family protein